MGRMLIVGLAAVALVLVFGIAGLSTFTADVTGPDGVQLVHCDAPVYGSGSNLTGASATACNDKARTRVLTAGAIGAGVAALGLVLSRSLRPRS